MTTNKSKIAQKRIGEKRKASNGMYMEIIEYRKADDIDVKFEDGTIVYNKEYQNFKKGWIKNSNGVISHIGEKVTAHNGMDMTIIAYRNQNDIDVQFEDGSIARKKQYNNFKKGYIAHPSKREKNPDVLAYIHRIGEKNVAKNGLEMEIIGYRDCHDMDIRFEDNVVVHHKSYSDFQKGDVVHPSRPEKIGQTSIAKNGMKITIIKYRNCNDIDVQFEDGVIVSNVSYKSFKSGYVKHPTKHKKVGETKLAKNNKIITIIAYRGCNDIDVEFEDGIVVRNKSYQSFLKGQIKHPNEEESRVGKIGVAANGMKMKIINYYSSSNIDVEFEDGYQVFNKTYSAFKHGKIRHPRALAIQRTGETRHNTDGYLMKIKDYRFGSDVDIEFEDGTVLYHKNYYQFKQGTIRKPNNRTQGRDINGN